ncbi:MAG: hypothetical protein K2X81_18025 [Candidatus Obscuribacterales bacterium]|nr:hypothetical protein [Candidatus Obscuribacterales bacterium]
MVKNLAAEKRFEYSKKILAILAIILAYNMFRSATQYVGLSESTGNHCYIYKKANEPDAWDKLWATRALQSWRSPVANRKGLAIELVKGKILIGSNESTILKKLGEPTSAPNFYRIEYDLPTTGGESVCKLCLELNHSTKVIVDSYIEIEN